MKLFVDMDGTLNVFQSVKRIEELYVKGRFLNATPHMEVIKAVDWLILNTNIEVYILSAYLEHSEYALEEKNRWLDKYLSSITPENRIFVVCGESKADAVKNIFGNLGKDDYLFDDYSVNLHDWESAGGTGIKLLTGKNSTRGTWQGRTVDIKGDVLNQLLFNGREERKCK